MQLLVGLELSLYLSRWCPVGNHRGLCLCEAERHRRSHPPVLYRRSQDEDKISPARRHVSAGGESCRSPPSPSPPSSLFHSSSSLFLLSSKSRSVKRGPGDSFVFTQNVMLLQAQGGSVLSKLQNEPFKNMR